MPKEKPKQKLTLISFFQELRRKENSLFVDKTCILCRDGYHCGYHTKNFCLQVSFVLFGIYLMKTTENFFLFIFFLGLLNVFIIFLRIIALYAEYCAIIEAHPESRQSGKYLT